MTGDMDRKQEQWRSTQKSIALSAQTVTCKYPEDNHSVPEVGIFTYSVTNNSQIKFQNGDESYLFTVPKPWSVNEYFVTNMQRMVFSEIVTIVGGYGVVPAIRKSFAIDDKRRIRYYVVGREIVNPKLHQLPQVLSDAKLLLAIATKFHALRVCDGLEDAILHLADAGTVYVDSLKRIRSKDCALVEEIDRCKCCTEFRKMFLQEDLVYIDQHNSKSVTSDCSDLDAVNSFKMEVNIQNPEQTTVELEDIPNAINKLGNKFVSMDANPDAKRERFCDEFHVEIKEEPSDTLEEPETTS